MISEITYKPSGEDILKIRKLCSQVLGNNEISIKYHHKLGFNGIYVDVIVLALFKNEWEGVRDDLCPYK